MPINHDLIVHSVQSDECQLVLDINHQSVGEMMM